MITKFFGITNRNKFLNELIKVLREKFPDKESFEEIVNSIGQANGIASLDGLGKVPSEQLPSYVDDIIEVEDYAHLPEEGETGKIYVTLDTGTQYRWGGSEYVPLNENSVQGIGIKKIIKLTQAEYDALSEKDNEAVYITNYALVDENGAYIYYTDGSVSNYNVLEPNKTPVGVLVKYNETAFILHPEESSNDVYWSSNINTLIDGVTTRSTSPENDLNGEQNTRAAIASGLQGTAFDYAVNAVYTDNRKGYLPSSGEMYLIIQYANNINTALLLINGDVIATQVNDKIYWTSTQRSESMAWWAVSGYEMSNPSIKSDDGNNIVCRSISSISIKPVYKIYQGENLITSSDTIDSVEALQESVSNLQSTKVNKVATPTAGHLVKVDALGGLLDAGLAMVKMTKTEYDALVTKDASTMYLVDTTPITSNGVYIAYSDGSYSAYDTLDAGKTAIGVVLKTNNVSLLLYPSEGSNNIWSNNTPLVIEGVITTTDQDTALVDYAGKANTAAVIASGLAGSAFTFATDIGADWYLPACGEMEEIRLNATNINTALGLISGTIVNIHDNFYWASTQYDGNYAWNWSNTYGWSKNYKGTTTKCRAVKELVIKVTYKLYLGSILIADSNLPNEIEQLLASI